MEGEWAGRKKKKGNASGICIKMFSFIISVALLAINGDLISQIVSAHCSHPRRNQEADGSHRLKLGLLWLASSYFRFVCVIDGWLGFQLSRLDTGANIDACKCSSIYR